MFRLPATIFLSAFLLFQVQPLAGKYVLPWFGGGPGVWTACMLLFQVLLLVGYAYAHFVNTRLSGRRQAALHTVLLAASLALLPIVPDQSWKPNGDEVPTLRIVLLLVSTVGLPYFLLSTTGPLVQAWFGAKHPDRSPFRLYALSNVGSLLALVSYPLAVEPYFSLGTQAAIWSVLYGAFALLCGYGALRHGQQLRNASVATAPTTTPADAAQALRIAGGTKILWILLAATASTLLLATTNQLCQQVAVTPFLWIVPLAIYLISFILTFDAPRWYRRDVFGPLLAIAAVSAWYVVDNGPAIRLDVQLIVYCTALFAACMTCHGELVRLKPPSSQLTLFYLFISIGGALGGVLTACVAPFCFSGYWEYQLGLGGACLLLLACLDRDHHSPLHRLQPMWAWCGLGCAAIALCAALGKQALGRDAAQLAAARNFYGVLRVVHREQPGVGRQVAMIHGRIVHGAQCLDDEKRCLPTSYYGLESGIGVAARFHPRRDPSTSATGNLRVGVIGLGAGTMAVYGRTGDLFRFYEINPDVVRLAREHFRFLDDCAAKVEVVVGDARVMLEQESRRGRPQRFDVLVIDAFSGDAVPLHLLTRECFALYRSHMADDGLLVLHVSNDHVDLTPVVRGAAAESAWQVRAVRSADDPAAGTQRSDWLIVTANRDFLANRRAAAHFQPLDLRRPAIVWTDDFGSLRQVLK
jgi:hypothetical protein